MLSIRARLRLDSLLWLAAFVSLALGGLRTWRADEARRPRPSERLARSLLDARSVARDRTAISTGDALFPTALVVTALAGSLLARKLAR
jgi:hypothetical protein